MHYIGKSKVKSSNDYVRVKPRNQSNLGLTDKISAKPRFDWLNLTVKPRCEENYE